MTFPKISKTQQISLNTHENQKLKQSYKETSYKKSENRQQVKLRNINDDILENSKNLNIITKYHNKPKLQ